MIKPPRLYKYEPFSTQSLINLKAQTIFFGSPLRFNDPYDCALVPNLIHPTDIETEQIRAALLSEHGENKSIVDELQTFNTQKLRESFIKGAKEAFQEAKSEFLNKRGVTCFSETNNNLLMWSHYANKSQGFCLEFDTNYPPFEKIEKVDYKDTIPTIEMSSVLLHRNYDEFFIKLYITKSTDWAYEQEWRGIHKVRDTAFTYESRCLTGVYFGPDVPSETREIICLILQGQNETVRFYRGRRSESQFKMLFEEFTYTSYLEAKRQGRL